MAEIVQSADTQAEWQTGTLDGVEATSGGDLVLAQDYALSFDGVDDYVDCGTFIDIPTDYTVEFRYRPTVDGRKEVFSWYSKAAFKFQTGENRPDNVLHLRGRFNGSWDDVVIAPAHNTNTEYFLSLAYDHSIGFQLYIDGVRVDQNSNTGYFDARDEVSRIGANSNGDYCYGGSINDFRIWNVARTQTEIQDNMNAALNGDEPGLVVYYPFTDGSGTTLTDATGNGNDGTIYGATWVQGDGYLPTGTRTAPTIDLSTLGIASETSNIAWSATDNSQTITIETALSTDGGTTWGAWQTATNGGSIPGITTGMDLSTAQLKCRQTLSTTDTAVTPQLHSITVTVREQSLLSGAITEMGVPVARTVRAYRRSDGALLAETTSDGTDGSFSMDVGIDAECYVVTLDDTTDGTDYNAQIADRLVPGR